MYLCRRLVCFGHLLSSVSPRSSLLSFLSGLGSRWWILPLLASFYFSHFPGVGYWPCLRRWSPGACSSVVAELALQSRLISLLSVSSGLFKNFVLGLSLGLVGFVAVGRSFVVTGSCRRSVEASFVLVCRVGVGRGLLAIRNLLALVCCTSFWVVPGLTRGTVPWMSGRPVVHCLSGRLGQGILLPSLLCVLGGRSGRVG